MSSKKKAFWFLLILILCLTLRGCILSDIGGGIIGFVWELISGVFIFIWGLIAFIFNLILVPFAWIIKVVSGMVNVISVPIEKFIVKTIQSVPFLGDPLLHEIYTIPDLDLDFNTTIHKAKKEIVGSNEYCHSNKHVQSGLWILSRCWLNYLTHISKSKNQICHGSDQ